MPKLESNEANAFKTCPRCGATVFKDMDTCYGCMFNFVASGDERGGAQDVIYEQENEHTELSPADFSFEELDEPEGISASKVNAQQLLKAQFETTLSFSFLSNKPLYATKGLVDLISRQFAPQNPQLTSALCHTRVARY